MKSKKRYYVRHHAEYIAFDILYTTGCGFKCSSTHSWTICKRDSAGNLRITKGKGSIAGVMFFREIMSAHEVSSEQYVRALKAALAWAPPERQQNE